MTPELHPQPVVCRPDVTTYRVCDTAEHGRSHDHTVPGAGATSGVAPVPSAACSERNTHHRGGGDHPHPSQHLRVRVQAWGCLAHAHRPNRGGDPSLTSPFPHFTAGTPATLPAQTFQEPERTRQAPSAREPETRHLPHGHGVARAPGESSWPRGGGGQGTRLSGHVCAA